VQAFFWPLGPALLGKTDFRVFQLDLELREPCSDIINIFVRQRFGDHIHDFIVALAVTELLQLTRQIDVWLACQ